MNRKFGKFFVALLSISFCFIVAQNVTCLADEIPSTASETPIVQMTSTYTYDEMCEDMVLLANAYPDYVHIASTAITAEGRNIPYMILGNIDAPSSIMIQGSIHAREYLCTQVIMKMAETYAADNISLGNVNLYVVPMANPDGVSIAQMGAVAAYDEPTRNFIIQTGHLSEWKSNAMGVDLNRNFDTGWISINQGVYSPSYMLYKGASPDSESEVQFLMSLAYSKPFSAFISYHMVGNLIYYDEPGNSASNSTESSKLATVLSGVTGYKTKNLNSCLSSTGKVVQGGFTDWVQLTFDKPAVTLELGSVLPPAGQKYANDIYQVNLLSWVAAAQLYQ